MVCQRCGRTVASSESFCGRCGARLERTVGVLTPPPDGAATGIDLEIGADQAPTVLGDADQTRFGPDAGQTRLAPDADHTRLAPEADHTRLASEADGTRLALDADQTRLGPPVDASGRPATEDAAATRLASTSTPPPPAIPTEADDHGPLAIGQTFGNRYHIIRLLGIGGMGAVYQAWDAELAVSVALKVIRPEVMADPKTAAEIERRFKRELLLARQVTHRNVVRIHDLGDIGGIKYITMSYVEGSDLASVLREEGRLSPVRALKIVRSVVSGLVEAHKAGVVHRDLKPANIMIDEDDQALIMDFGIARSTGRPTATVPGNTTIVNNLKIAVNAPADATVLGSVIGTVEYMAPEQARGEHIDQRADIYALGLIIYDMLVGQPRAKRAGNAIAELQARMEKAPPTVKSLVPEIPVALDQLVSRCLEPDPAKRYQTTQELAEALTWINDKGERIRVKRVVGMRLFAAAIVLGLGLLAGTWWFARGPELPVEHEPVSVVIADFQNLSNDKTFDGTLEPMLKLALEGAGFISAYDRAGVRSLVGASAPTALSEEAAQQVAIKQGLGVVVSGSVDRQGNGYGLAIKATQAITGVVITSAKGRAASKDRVLSVATGLADKVREALGDETSDDAKRFAMDTLSATSLDVVRHYATGMQALSNGKSEDALQSFSEAVKLDPKFGIGYHLMAVSSRNLDRWEDAQKYSKEALRYLDGMTERERYRTRGYYYRLTGDYQACVKEYGDLVARYAADASARNQIAVCSSYLRDLSRSVEEMRQAVRILPKRALYRQNLATFLNHAGDFQAAEQEIRALSDPGVFGLLAIAFAQLGQGQTSQAIETYQKLGETTAQGKSYAASGLGDVAVYEGRFADAVRILTQSAPVDLAAKDDERTAAKYAALAYTRLQLRQKGPAIDAAANALAHSELVKIRFLAARIFVETGESTKARSLAAGLASERQAEPQAYAKIIEGMSHLKKGDATQAVKSLTEANALFDSWIGRFELGRAYFEAKAYLQADSEFDRCLKRRGEALALFLDDEPTYGYLPPLYYYQGRVREALGTAGYAESYRSYLNIREKANEDPLLPEVRRRAGGS